MREAQLSILLVSVLTAGMITRGLAVPIKKDNQPRQQGVPTGATVFFHHLFTRNVGRLGRKDVYNPGTQAMDHVETQNRESRYQIGALAPQTPSDPTLPLAVDFANAAAAVMQSDAALATFRAQSVGVQWVSEVGVIYFVDDRDQNEANPTFTVILSHTDISTVPGVAITKFALNVARV